MSNRFAGVAWTQGGKAVLSASLDGTVRAFDLKRYRNFRTFASPQPAQFSCIAVDSSGELIAAGCQDLFDIYVWSMKTGRLLEALAGHESPVSSLDFCPKEGVLASTSWDKTLRIWNVFEGKTGREVFDLSADGIAVQFAPTGKHVAVATIDCQITIFDWNAGNQIVSIEGRLDFDAGRAETDVITAKKSSAAKYVQY